LVHGPQAPEIKVLYPEATIGKGILFLGRKDGTGEVHSFVKENDSIAQK
jgi:hypothetical protein